MHQVNSQFQGAHTAVQGETAVWEDLVHPTVLTTATHHTELIYKNTIISCYLSKVIIPVYLLFAKDFVSTLTMI